MKLTLERNITFIRKRIIATLSIEQKRDDIHELLSKDISELPPRLQDYLKKMGLVINYNELTQKGEKAKDTGLVPENEYGQFEVWYLNEDDWFDKKPVAIRRIRAGDRKERGEHWEIINAYCEWGVSRKQDIYDKDSQKTVILYSFKPKTILEEQSYESPGKCTCNTEDMDSNEIPCTLKAALRWSIDEKDSQITREETHRVNPKDILANVFGNDRGSETEYDKKTNTMLIHHIPDNPTEFTSTFSDSNNSAFSLVKIENIPLRAATSHIAKEWIEHLRVNEWEDQYVSREQTEMQHEDWLSLPAFDGFIIPSPSIEELLEELKNKSRRAYWNVAVMQDLRPHTAKVRLPFTLESGSHSVKDTIRKNLFEGMNVSEIIISDRYITEKNLEILQEILPNKSRVTLYTRDNNFKSLPSNWKCEKLPGKRDKNWDDHSRIWMIKCQSDWKFWTFGHSMTPFKKDGENRIYVDSLVHVSPIYKLPDYLSQHVNSKQKQNGGQV